MRKGEFSRQTTLNLKGRDLEETEKCESAKYTIIDIYRAGLRKVCDDLDFAERIGK